VDIKKRFKILFVTAEAAPFSKVGGLGDVAGSLPRFLAALGHDVRVVSPLYRQVAENFRLEPGPDNVVSALGDTPYRVGMKKLCHDGITHCFLDCPGFFDRDGIYGFDDDGERFVLFSRGVLACLKRLDWQPDIIHCNDWQTALIPAIMKTTAADDPFFSDTASVYTIHNIQYQGVFPPEFMHLSGLPPEEFHFTKTEFFGELNFMKTGITYADRVNTVSRTFMEEIQTPEYGYGLEEHLRAHREKLHGILNGIDYEKIDPETNVNIYENYSAQELDGKEENRRRLMDDLDLEPGRGTRDPVVGIISRLMDQKGLDILAGALDDIVDSGVLLAVLGTGDPKYELMLGEAAGRHPGRISVNLKFDLELADRMYAGCDMVLIPSKFEPCGLVQMMAMRFGTIPVARATGGLVDTIADYDPGTRSGNGFLFTEYSAPALGSAMSRAVSTFRDAEAWRDLVLSAMSLDYSWNASAREYEAMYSAALSETE